MNFLEVLLIILLTPFAIYGIIIGLINVGKSRVALYKTLYKTFTHNPKKKIEEKK